MRDAKGALYVSMPTFLQMPLIILLVVILFNFIILVHELGHFLAARWRGLHVEKFQIWFGKPLWKKTVNGVQYGLGWIPAGGFVALPQLASMEMLEGVNQERDTPLEAVRPLDKIIVAFAGPLFSFGLAVVFACLVWAVKRPVPESELTTTIGHIHDIGAEGANQLLPNDVIKEVNGNPVGRWSGMTESVTWEILSSDTNEIEFLVDRPGEGIKTITVKAVSRRIGPEPSTWLGKLFQRPPLRMVGLQPKHKPMINKFLENSPLHDSELRPMDVVLALDGEEVRGISHFSEILKRDPEKRDYSIRVERHDKESGDKIQLDLPIHAGFARITEETDEGTETSVRKMVGLQWETSGITELRREHPWEQITGAVRTMKNTLAAVLSPQSQVSFKHLGGPAAIMNLYYRLFEDKDGWRRALWFSVILNVNLAILNLLPIPVLDGGHIVLALFEMIRGRSIPARILEFLQVACALLLIGFMIFITGFDLNDIFGGKKRKDPTQEWLNEQEIRQYLSS